MRAISIVARCAGDRIEPPRLIERHAVEALTVWRRGDQDRRGRVADSSGLNISIGEVPSDRAADAALAWVARHAALIAEVAADGGETELDFGVFVPAFIPNGFQLSPVALATLGKAGVTVTVSAYPVSDEEDAT